MKKIILFTGLMFLIIGTAFTQWKSVYWGRNTGDIDLTSAVGLAVTVDNSANCYVTGYTYNSETGNDIIIIKYDANGDTVWTRSYNGNNNSDDQGFGIAADSYGNIFVTGTASYTGNSYDIVLLKYNSGGELQWAGTYSGFAGNADDKGQALTIDNNGNIYVTGYCTIAGNTLNMATIKFNEAGEILWARKEGGPENNNSKGFAICADNMGNINVTGYTTTGSGGIDILTVQYGPDGTRNWYQIYNDTNVNQEDKAFGIVADGSGNVIITGYTSADASNNTNYITLKYNSSGELQWKKTYNGLGNGEDKAFGIAADTDGSVYITGFSAGDATGLDYVTIKYSSDGQAVWGSAYNGTGNLNDRANAIGILHNSDNTTDIIVTGASWGSNNNDDYATVKYSSVDGSQLLVNRYSMTGNSEDVANSIAVYDDKAYITGYSSLIVESSQMHSAISTISLSMGESSELITEKNIPGKFRLYQNYPNPFNPSTTIKFDLSKNSNVKLVVYDILGRIVTTLINQNMNAGSFSITFTTNNIASGLYFYKLTAGDYNEIKKMTLVK